MRTLPADANSVHAKSEWFFKLRVDQVFQDTYFTCNMCATLNFVQCHVK